MKNIKKCIYKKSVYVGIILIVLLLFVDLAAAVPAYPGRVLLTQPDGYSFEAQINGDERIHWVETSDGYTITISGDTWYYASKSPQGELEPTNSMVGKDKPSGLQPHITPEPIQANQVHAEVPPVGVTGENTPAANGAPSTGTVKVIVIRVNFSDRTINSSHDYNYFDNLINGATGSLKQFYNETSYGKINVVGTIGPVVTLPNTMAYYSNPETPAIIQDAMNAADPSVDFSLYDSVMVYHAGLGEESSGNPNDYWSMRWSGLSMTHDGKTYTSGIVVPEAEASPLGALGVTAHEFGHEIGLPDLYNTATGGTVVYYWDLMDVGSWNNNGNTPAHPSAWDKKTLGWLTPVDVTLNSTKNVLQLENNTDAYKVRISAMPANEYFLVENREQVGYDTALPEAGVLIWHVDESRPNNNGAVKMLIPEDASNGAVGSLRGAAYSLNDGQIEFTPGTAPNSNTNGGVSTGISIKDIGNEGQSMPVTINFSGDGGGGGQQPCPNSTKINFDDLPSSTTVGSNYPNVVFSPGYITYNTTGSLYYPPHSTPNIVYTYEQTSNITFNDTISYVEGYFNVALGNLSITAYDASNNSLGTVNVSSVVTNQLVSFNFLAIKRLMISATSPGYWTIDDLSYCGGGLPCGKVLFDEGHGNYWKTTYGYVNFTKELVAAGYTVDTLNGYVTPAILSQYKLFITDLPISGFTPDEAAAIQNYVYNGGSVFLIGEWGNGWGTTSLNNVSAPFGIQARSDTVNQPTNYRIYTYWPIISNVAPPITGVASYIEYAGASLQTTSPAWAVAWSDNDSYAASPPAESNSPAIGIVEERILPPVVLQFRAASPAGDISTSSTGAASASDASRIIGSSIAVIATTTVNNSVLKALNESGYVFDYYFTNDFTSINYAPYTTIIVAMDGGLVNEASISALRDQLNLGKKVIMLGGTAYQPFVNGTNTYLMQINTSTYYWNIPYVPHLTITYPSSPLAAGLPSMINFSNTGAAYYMLRVLDTGITNVAMNGDSQKALFHKVVGPGDLVWFINSPNEYYWSNNTDYQYFKKVLVNAMNYKARGAQPVIAVSTPQKGRVAYVADSDIFDDYDYDSNGIPSLYELNNKQVLLSLVQWLVQSCNAVPAIDVSPASFNLTLGNGLTATRIMNISNLGSADLVFNITDSAHSPVYIKIPAGLINDQPRSAASAGNAPSAAVNAPSASPAGVFTANNLKMASIPIKVLLVAADESNITSAILSGFPDLIVDRFDARKGTPSLAQLQQYDAVIVWSDWSFNDPTALGNVLADYADSGGKIIIQTFSWYGYSNSLQGRITTGGYNPFTREGPSLYSTASLGWYNASHPIMAGVTGVTDYFRDNVTLTPGATLVANWSDNEPFIATNGSVVGINSYIGDYYQWTGDIPLIEHNTLLWLTGQSGADWLTENPLQGTVSPGGTMPITLTVNATALNFGNYAAELNIISNDPIKNPVKVPVNLTVVSTAGKCYDYDDALWITPPAYGDWNVGHRIECNDLTIKLNGNLDINGPGGNLSFNNITLNMNVTKMGEYSIDVNSGGKFFVNSRRSSGSVITNGQNASAFYTFKVNRGSTFQMRNSTVKYAGTGYVLPDYSNDGLWINTDNVVLDNNTVTVSHFDGIYLNRSNNSRITNNRIYSNSWNGIRGVTANNLVISGNKIYSNGWTGIALDISANSNLSKNSVYNNLYDGISIGYAPNAAINNNTVTGNQNNGIVLSSASSAGLAGNNASYNLNDGITISSSPGVNIKSNTVSNNSDVGITLGSSSTSNISQNTVNNNREGIYISGSSNVKSDRNIVLNNRWYGIHLYLSNSNIVSGNKVNLTTKELASSAVYLSNSSSSTINNNMVFDNLNGIQLWYSPNAYISYNSVGRTKGDLKSTALYLSNSATGQLAGNNVSDNWEGIVLWVSPNVVINGNTMISNSNNGIKIQNSGGSDIIRNYARSNGGSGISVTSSDSVDVNNNTAIKGGTGISISSSNYGGINDNLASGNGYGISLGGSGYHDMNNNTAQDNTYGITLGSSSFNNVTNSAAGRNNFGLYMSYSSNNNNVLYNNFSSSPNYGGFVFKSYYNNISDNNLQKSGIGLHLEESNSNDILRNDERWSNNYGVDLYLSHNNNISRNDARYSKNIGVSLSSSNSNRINDTQAEANSMGVSLRWSNNNAIVNNNARSDDIGIYLFNSGGNTVVANNASNNNNEGIEISASSGNDVNDNTVLGNSQYGIHAYSSTANNLINNTVQSNGVGVYLDWSTINNILQNRINLNKMNGLALSYVSDSNTIRDNAVNSDGNISIKVSNSKNNIVENNEAQFSDVGIFMDWSKNNTVRRNTANGNNIHGISLEWYSDSNKITENSASGNIVGLSLMWSSLNTIENNTLNGNNVSTNLEWSSNNNALVNNTMRLNNYGISMMWSSNNNTIAGNLIDSNARLGMYMRDSNGNIIYNNYISNPDNAYDNGANSWNITKTSGSNIIGGLFLGGNYWSDYAGADTNGDGLGDTLIPYNSGGNISNGGDYLPLVAVDNVPPESITALRNTTYAPDYINWTWNDSKSMDFSRVMVYINGKFKTNVSKGVRYYNSTGLIANTSYTISTHTVDTSGNVNSTWVNRTARTARDSVPPASITNLTNTSYAPNYIKWTWSDPKDADFTRVTVYINGNFRTNVSKGVRYYNSTGLIANTSYTISTHTVDTSGNVNSTWVNRTARTKAI